MTKTRIDLGDIIIDDDGVRVVSESLAIEVALEMAGSAPERPDVRGGAASGVTLQDHAPKGAGRLHGKGRLPTKPALGDASPTVPGAPGSDT
jgi:hypothetical protein